MHQGVHPPGVIVIPCGELGRYSAFTYSMACLQYPPGSTISMMQSLSIPRNLNICIRDALDKKDKNGSVREWVHLTADDHVFEPDMLVRLLDRDVDVVVPLILRRRPPFSPVLFKGERIREDGITEYESLAYDELPRSGLFPVYSAGTGGMTIKRHVLERIREMQGHDLWFEFQQGEVLSEDVDFVRKIRDAGFQVHVDMDVRMGHVGNFIVWPDRKSVV